MRYALFLFVLLNLLPAASAAQDLPITDPLDAEVVRPSLPSQDEVNAIVVAFITMEKPHIELQVGYFKKKCRGTTKLAVMVNHHLGDGMMYAGGWQDLIHEAVRSYFDWEKLEIRVASQRDTNQTLWAPEIDSMSVYCHETPKPKKHKKK